ncbi:MAG: hypothetical protein OZ926_14790 [Pseudomonas sp.]|nr:hypothetical protein [Pseudomonas sp.]
MNELQASPEQCPGCGVYYAKVLAATKAPEQPKEAQVNRRDVVLHVRKSQAAVFAALVIGLLIGYFAGREHVKYEFRSALQDSLAGLGAAFGGGAKSISKVPKASPKPAVSSPLMTGVVLDKGFYEGEYGQDSITLDMQFSNQSGRDIRAFEGVMVFSDLLGNIILNLNIAINEPIAKGMKVNWSGGIDYNQFKDSHQRLRSEPLENIKADFRVSKILYSDGELKEL